MEKSVHIIKRYQLGLKYLSIQPKPFKQKTLIFPELKMARLFKLSQRIMPPFIFLVIFLFYFFGTNLVASVITILLAFSLPIHAILWFGYRANSPITLNLIPLYNHLKILINKEQIIATTPDFYELMSLLSFAQKNFTEDEIF